jgi:hypothetical protein
VSGGMPPTILMSDGNIWFIIVIVYQLHGRGQQVCCSGGGWVMKAIIVFSFDQAEQSQKAISSLMLHHLSLLGTYESF